MHFVVTSVMRVECPKEEKPEKFSLNSVVLPPVL